MRGWVGPSLVLVGTLLLVLGLLAVVWIGPTVRQAPVDQRSATISTGSGTYYDFAQGQEVESDQLESVVNTESDQTVYDGEDAIDDDIGVYDQTSGLFDRAADYEITYSDTRIAIDRSTALPVDCCDAGPDEGLTIKWPFGTEQRDYPLWNGSLGEAVTASFEGVEEVDGLEVYRFVAEVPATDAGPATEEEFPRVEYEATQVYLVEPVTGRIISSQQDVRQSLTDEDGEVLFDVANVSLSVSDETIADNVALGDSESSLLGLLGLLTWLGPLLGIVLVGAGIWLAAREREQSDGTVAG